jgi:hypothetical protein
MKTAYGQVLLVDDGGFFPEEDNRRDAAWFLMDAMKTLGTDAVNVGERDLRFGRAFLEQRARKSGLPVTSANLFDKKSHRTLFSPYLIKKVGTVNVGLFGLTTNKLDLGPGKDSLFVEDPVVVARRTIIDLKRKGAQVIVLLSQLGKVEAEDLVTAVDGVDAVIMGHNVMLIQRGRMVKNTIACYGGEQGQYLCRTELTLDDKRHMTTGEAEAILLGPEIPDKPEIASLVKGFEDALKEKNRKIEMEQAVKNQVQGPNNSVSHYLGSELCIRCHPAEGAAWKTTSHSQAWQTLVTVKKDADADCIPCHSLGYLKPGGFVTGASTPKLGNVQCESCHGMGTEHDAFVSAPHQIDAATCTTCHDKERDPNFSFETYLPKITHSNLSGETLENRKVKKPGDEKAVPNMMKSSSKPKGAGGAGH